MKTQKNSKIGIFLAKAQTALLYSLPVVIFFSYYPVITVGQNDSMNLELSIPLIWLILFFLISIPKILSFIKESHKKSILLFLFPLYVSLSIIWSPNKLRAVLTTGILWLLIFAIISIHQTFKDKNVVKNTTFKTKIISIFLISTLVVCLFCWLQCFLDVVGINREITLLCPGCTYHIFGFPHPNGLAIEPQFMGNLLIAPAIFAIYFSAKSRKKSYVISSLIITSTLFLTLSRGAIYSFVIGTAFMTIYYLIKHQKAILITVPIIIISAILSFLAQGLFSELSPTDETFFSGIAKSVHQLSLGKIDIRQKEPAYTPATNSDVELKQKAQFDGYIEFSTDMRLSFSQYALNTWSKNPLRIISGTGIGGAGMAVAEEYEEVSSKQIIQNQYLSLLLELGIIGCILAVIPILFFVKLIYEKRLFWLLSILLAYALSVLFFAGLPNALHIYLLPPLIFCVYRPRL